MRGSVLIHSRKLGCLLVLLAVNSDALAGWLRDGVVLLRRIRRHLRLRVEVVVLRRIGRHVGLRADVTWVRTSGARKRSVK